MATQGMIKSIKKYKIDDKAGKILKQYKRADPKSTVRDGEVNKLKQMYKTKTPIKAGKAVAPIAGQVTRGLKRRKLKVPAKKGSGLMDTIKSGASKIKKWLSTSDGKMSV